MKTLFFSFIVVVFAVIGCYQFFDWLHFKRMQSRKWDKGAGKTSFVSI